MIEGKILKVLIEAKINKLKKVLTKTLLSRIRDIENAINSVDINKIVIIKSSKREVDI